MLLELAREEPTVHSKSILTINQKVQMDATNASIVAGKPKSKMGQMMTTQIKSFPLLRISHPISSVPQQPMTSTNNQRLQPLELPKIAAENPTSACKISSGVKLLKASRKSSP